MAIKTNINSKQSYLWNMVPFGKDRKKTDDTDLKKVATYKLFPAGTKINEGDEYFTKLKEFISPPSIISVLNDYSWTSSPSTAREDAPYIILNEKQVWKNNTIAKLIYSLTISKEFLDSFLNTAEKIDGKSREIINYAGDKVGYSISEITKKLEEMVSPKNIVTPEVTKGGTRGAQSGAKTMAAKTDGITANTTGTTNTPENDDFIDKSIKMVKNTIAEMMEKIKDVTLINDIKMCDAHSNFIGPSSPYRNLYLCLNSGFRYYLPYFENEMRGVDNTWGESDASQNPIFDEANKWLYNINRIVGGVELWLDTEKRGYYFEQTKAFNYPTNGETLNIRFPLINTNTWEDVVKNWHFIFLLLYQNQPSRNDISIIEPPAIYEVEIPNMRYIPYAYIEKLAITYKGVRRNMKIPILKNGKPDEIETIIPEAWDVNITLRGLTSEPSNFNILNKHIITTNKL